MNSRGIILSTLLDNPEFPANDTEGVKSVLEILLCMRGGDDRAQTRLVAGHGGEADALCKHAPLEQRIRHLRSRGGLPDDDGRDGTLAEAGVEPELLEAGFEEPRVIPQFLDPLGLGLEDVQRREAGDRKSTRLNSSHSQISYAVFCLKKKKKTDI